MKVFRSAVLFLSMSVLAAPVALANQAIPLPANFLGLTALEIGPGGPDDALTDIVNNRWHPGHTAAAVKPALQSAVAATVSAASLLLPPVVAGQRVQGAGNGVTGFNGINHFDQRFAGTGAYANSQFSLEPPDQALCVGKGYVMEAVNNAVAVYSRAGALVSGPTPLSQFFKLAPEVIRGATPSYGPFISDPRCLYDQATSRWFLTELEIDEDPVTGALGTHSSVLVAVSATADPTGKWYLYSFDTTNGDGTLPGHAACPCFGDQPLIGADVNGFYISTNEFPISAAGFNGAQLYAISKAALESGRRTQVSSINIGSIPVPLADQPAGGIWYTVAPSVTVAPSAPGSTNVEYFLSTLQFGQTPFDNRLAVWALTGTDTLNSNEPELALRHTVVTTQPYGMDGSTAFAASQNSGPTPLRDALGDTDAVEQLQANDDRMNHVVVYQGGDLWGAVNTSVSVAGQTHQGLAWFRITPALSGDRLSAQTHNQGYAAVAGEDLLFPSLAVNPQGSAVIAFTLAGADNWPSAAYAKVGTQTGSVHVSGPGVGPADGFTAYAAYGGNGAGRWGDYSAAVADERGEFWLANEFIGQTCTFDQFALDTTCGGTRSLLANWATFITHIPKAD
jgi:hypothetical protein